MNHDDRDRPSIFSRPFEDDGKDEDADPPHPEPLGADAPETWRTATIASHQIRPPAGDRGDPGAAEPAGTALTRQVILLGSMGLAILALGGFIAGSVLRAGDDPALAAASVAASASPVTTESSESSPSIEPSAEATAAVGSTTPAATPAPTPVPTPAGPPEELTVGGWATVRVGELNVRQDASLGSTSVYRLVRSAVANVIEGPRTADGYAWYRIASLGGATGWAASGPQSSPFLQTIAEAGDLIQCGRVTGSVYEVSGSSLRSVDPVHIGDVALPAGAFEPIELATLELLRGNEQEACFAAAARSGGQPSVYADFGATTCGRPVAVGDHFELRPAIGQDVITDFVAKRTTYVHPSILLNGSEADPMSVNLRSAIGVLAASEGATACVHSYTRDDPLHQYRMIDGRLCGVPEAINGAELLVRPGSGTARFRFLSVGTWPGGETLPIGQTVPLMVNVSLWVDDQYVNVWRPELAGGC